MTHEFKNKQYKTLEDNDAAPLKRIYIEQEYSAPFADELKAVGMTEDIKVATIHDNLEWVQDDKV